MWQVGRLIANVRHIIVVCWVTCVVITVGCSDLAPDDSTLMIPHAEFGQLRLKQFLPMNAEIHQLESWQFQGFTWVGEAAAGFNEWLRLEDDPNVLRAVSIDLDEFPPDAARRVFERLRLPVHSGMTLAELAQVLGPPVGTQQFVSDRLTHEFLTPGPHRYRLLCTVRNQGGLYFIVILVPPIGDPDPVTSPASS